MVISFITGTTLLFFMVLKAVSVFLPLTFPSIFALGAALPHPT